MEAIASDWLRAMTADRSSYGLPEKGRQEDHTATKRRHRPYVWLGTIATAFVVAIVTSWGTGIGNDLLSIARGHNSPSGAPVKIDSVSLGRNAAQGGSFVFAQERVFSPRDLRAVSQLGPGSPQYYTWFRSKGGVDPSLSIIKLVVEGNRTHPVQIIGMNLVKHCQRPLNGTLFYSPPAGAGNTIGIGFDLDSVTSTAQNLNNYRISGDYFVSHTISLKQGEVQTLEVVAVTGKQYCQFTIKMTVVEGGATTTETITNHGQPFRVSALEEGGYFGPGALRYYKVLYVGGVALGVIGGVFTRKNPATYNDT
jgi:hypothetical protein